MPVYQDQIYRKVEIRSYPERIVSLVPSQTELLSYLNLDQEVKGITKFCIYPSGWFQTKQKIGGTKNLKVDLIKTLEPDLIIGNKEENNREQIEELAASFPVWISDVETLKQAIQMITALGKITNRYPQSQMLATLIHNAFSAFVPAARTIKVAYIIWDNPLMAAGSKTFIDHMLQRCGFENVFGKQNLRFSRYPEISDEHLKIEKPDLILLSSEPFPFREKHVNEYRRRFPESHVLKVNGEYFSWYGSRLLHAPEYFHSLLSNLTYLLEN